MAKMILPARDLVSVSQSINIDSIQELLFDPSLALDEELKPSVDTYSNTLHIYLKSTSVSGRCPCCGETSSTVNSTSFRHPQWMPLNGMTTYAHIALKRYACKNTGCVQRTFVEQPDHVRSGQHRSDLVNLVVFAISIFCSDIVTAMICREMGILISHDSANRMLEKMSLDRRLERYERIMRMRQDWFDGKYESKGSLAQAYGMSAASARRYLNMSDEEAAKIKDLKERGKRKTDMDNYMNIIYKMLDDGQTPDFVYSYILHLGYTGSVHSLVNHIKAVAGNNFGIRLGMGFPNVCSYPKDTVIIRRFDVLKYITLKDRSKMEDTDVAEYYSIIEEKFAQVKACAEIWNDFYPVLMGDDPDKLDGFLKKYEDSPVRSFVNGIKMDIAPVRNAISTSVSSGFVEGGNCRYKATKRLMFGRSGLRHLFLKTYATSIIMRTEKNAGDLIAGWLRKNTI